MQKIPKHIAIILDGNRRWAKQHGLRPWHGHHYGKEKLKQLLKWCAELKIKQLTLYCFSMQNFSRSTIEVKMLMSLIKKGIEEILKSKDIKKHGIRFKVIGRKHALPADVQRAIAELESATAQNKGLKVNLAIAYGGREEIIDALRAIAKDVKNRKLKAEHISEKTFEKYLYLSDTPDLIIRTSGERRTSNFLLWQSAYSEWLFHPKLWPEFTKHDFIQCLEDYAKRKRRFGK